MNTVILVPYRGDGGRRDELWAFTEAHLHDHHPYPIIEGSSPDGPFNRAAAINDAAGRADWDIAVISDADTICPPEQLDDAVQLAAVSGRLVFAFTTVTELDQATTDQLLAGTPLLTEGIVQIRRDELGIQSSLCAVPRCLWNKVGGMDDKFVGWSAEDNAFTKACTIMGGDPLRVDGTVYHLWHPTSRPSLQDHNYRRNQIRWRRYAQACTETDLAKLRCGF